MIGMVRKVDELGRIVIPKEMRRVLNIKTGSNVEIIIEENNAIILKKFSQISNLHTFAEELAGELHDVTGEVCLVCDEDCIITSCGGNKRDFDGKKIAIEEGRDDVPSSAILNLNKEYSHSHVFPIFCDGFVSGYAIVLSNEELRSEAKESVKALTSFFSKLLSI